MKSDRPSLEPMYRAIRDAASDGRLPPLPRWPAKDDRDPLDFSPRVLSDDEKVARYLDTCRGLGFSEDALPKAEAWFRENRL